MCASVPGGPFPDSHDSGTTSGEVFGHVFRFNSRTEAGQPSLRPYRSAVVKQQASKARLRDSPDCELQFADYTLSKPDTIFVFRDNGFDFIVQPGGEDGIKADFGKINFPVYFVAYPSSVR